MPHVKPRVEPVPAKEALVTAATKVPKGQPLCMLQVELDGSSSERLTLYPGEDPVKVVDRFGAKYNLSVASMQKLLD